MSRQRLPATADADRPVTARQREVVEHIMRTGEGPYECAEALGSTPSSIYQMLRKPHVRRYLQELTLEHVGILAPIAVRKQQELLHAESEHVRASVAENILDRHLGKPVMRQQVALQGQINVTIDLG